MSRTLGSADHGVKCFTGDFGTPRWPACTFDEATTNELVFNVMPDRPVREKLLVRKYNVRPRFIEAIFDREYHSSMEKSPSHLIFLTALAHMQKMVYVYFCTEFELGYDPHGPEKLKIWPTHVDVRMPGMITSEKEISHRLWITRLTQKSPEKYFVDLHSVIDGIVTIDVTAMLLKI